MSAAEAWYECSCDADGYWNVGPTTTNVKAARKLWYCAECGCNINPGESYEHIWGVWDGESTSIHTCVRCVELRRWAIISVPCFCWNASELHEGIRGMVGQVAPHIPGFFMEFGRRMVVIRRRARADREERKAR